LLSKRRQIRRRLCVSEAPVRLGVVGAVGKNCQRSSAWASALPAHGRDRLDERQELGDVVAVGAREQAGERDAVGVGDQVVLAAGSAAVDGARSGLTAPKSARKEKEEESQTAREKSSRSA
jgi:hypothetical protein